MINIGEYEYLINDDGVLQQLNPVPIEYNKEYLSKGYGNIVDKIYQMSYLRYGYMIGVIGKPTKLMEIGYGTGHFLQLVTNLGIDCYGHDITGIPVPNGATECDVHETVDVVCMFDVLEHMLDINMIKNLNTKFVYISVPNCEYPLNVEYMKTIYPHLKPNEHIHHFNEKSLVNHFNSNGYRLVTMSNIEDSIRHRDGIDKNILTAVFEKIV